ncbi:MAG: hypothetical protein QF885_06245 [Candidatus Thalassarchaeaceae archaeon]|nr:hypothetical protein [Candidatus Thalassarchaeaceae archaeon]
MARGRGVLLTLLLVVSMMLAGCLSPDIQEWGSDGIEVSIDNNAKTATMSTHTGDLVLEDEVVNLIGCDGDGNISVGDQTNRSKVRIEGWLHLSKQFPDGADLKLGEPLIGNSDMMSPSAVIIQLDDYDEVIAPINGRVNGVKWFTPTEGKAVPPTPEGSNEMYTSSKFPHLGWAIVGLIPANEEILDGFAALDWHQPIALEGWLLDDYIGNYEIKTTDDGRCRIYAEGSTGESGFKGTLLVTSMTLGDHGLIDEDNSYNAFSVPIIGSWVYSALILLSFGGAFLLFLATTGLIRRGATLSARELLTEAQMIAARGVKSDFRKATQDIEEETGRKVKAAPKARAPKVEKIPEGESVELGDFDIDSAIHGAHRPSARSVSSASSGGVVQTEESVEMQDQMDEMDATRELEEAAKERGGGVFIPEGAIIMPDSESTKQQPVKEKATPPARKVRKTKAIKKEPDPEPKPAPPTKSGPDITDDEDFSDFSFD